MYRSCKKNIFFIDNFNTSPTKISRYDFITAQKDFSHKINLKFRKYLETIAQKLKITKSLLMTFLMTYPKNHFLSLLSKYFRDHIISPLIFFLIIRRKKIICASKLNVTENMRKTFFKPYRISLPYLRCEII